MNPDSHCGPRARTRTTNTSACSRGSTCHCEQSLSNPASTRHSGGGRNPVFRTIILIAALLLSAPADAAKMCMPCPLGTYSDTGTNGKCETCPAGNYCIQGVKLLCPERTYNDKTGQFEKDVCKSCGNLTAKADGTGCNQPVAAEYTGTTTREGVGGVIYKCNCRVKNEAGAWSRAVVGPICDDRNDGTNNCGKGLCASFCPASAGSLGASAYWD
jgi:hypothetical protein